MRRLFRRLRRALSLNPVRELQRTSERLARLTRHAPGMFHQYRISPDGKGQYIYVGPQCFELYGCTPEQLIGDPTTLRRLIHPDDVEKYFAAVHESHRTLAPWWNEHRVIHDDGDIRWIEAYGIPTLEPDDSIIWTGYRHDVTARKQDEIRLRVSDEKLHCLYDLSPLGIALSELDGRFVQVNHAIERITGFPESELLATNWWDWAGAAGDVDKRRRLEQLLEAGRFGPLERELTRKDGTAAPVRMNGVIVTTSDGKRRIWSMVEDIRERRDQEERINFLVEHDTVTGLENARTVRRRLEQAVDAAVRDQRHVCVLVIDVDRLKSVNDTLGHDAGDSVLVEVSRRLRAIVRDSDHVARYGGGTFVVVLPGVRNADAGRIVGNKICGSMHEKCLVQGQPVHLTVSIGVSSFPEDGRDAQSLLRHADIAMSAAKGDGRDTLRSFDKSLSHLSTDRLALENDLYEALAKREFELHYQPQVDTRTGAPAGLEALIRWNHPTRGMVSPATFIPIAEETGLIEEIGSWALEQACRDLRDWIDGGLPPVAVAVNLSPRQFARSDLHERLSQVLAATRLPPELLELEITESTAMIAPEQSILTIVRLRQLGVRVAIDDFGVGHSSLSRLRQLDVDRLKIDRSIVMHCADDANDAALCRAVIALGQALGLELVAEGVETQAQWAFLATEGCDVIQGYLYARPMTAAATRDFLAREFAHSQGKVAVAVA